MRPQGFVSLTPAHSDDLEYRMKRYLISMLIRTVCVVLVVGVDSPWRWLFAVGAVFLPYLAVIFANVGSRGATDPISPGSAMPPAITSSAAVPPAIEAAPR